MKRRCNEKCLNDFLLLAGKLEHRSNNITVAAPPSIPSMTCIDRQSFIKIFLKADMNTSNEIYAVDYFLFN